MYLSLFLLKDQLVDRLSKTRRNAHKTFYNNNNKQKILKLEFLLDKKLKLLLMKVFSVSGRVKAV